MKIRTDSPFAKLTEDECEKLLCFSKTLTLDELCKVVAKAPQPIHCSMVAMRKFIKRLEKQQRLETMEEDEELVEDLAKRSSSPAVRDATLQTMRQRMFDVAFESNNRELLMETFQALNEEKDKERAAEVEMRKVKVLEENAKLGWRKLECENARAGLKALPRVREVLADASRAEGERISEALQILGQMEVNPLVLMEMAREAQAVGMAEQKALPAPSPIPEKVMPPVTSHEQHAIVTIDAPGKRDGNGKPSRANPQLPARESKPGRNEPCPCGSGQKYKRCCEGKGSVAMRRAA
jgi:hypothetical protein